MIFGNFILKEVVFGGVMKDLYDIKFYYKFEKFLILLIKCCFVILIMVFVILVFFLVIMVVMFQSFFLKMNKFYFCVDLVFFEGFSIYVVDQDVMKVEDYLKNYEKVKLYLVILGGILLCYYLVSFFFGLKFNYVNVMVEIKDFEDVVEVEQQFYEYMIQNFFNIIICLVFFVLFLVFEVVIEIGFIGENFDILIVLVERVKKIVCQCDMVMDICFNWGDKVFVWKLMFF